MLSLKSEIQLLFFHTSWPVLNFEIGKVKQDWPPHFLNMFLHEYLPFFDVILKHIITTGIALLNITILLIIVVVICQQMIITVKLSFIITFKDRH